ncbi:MAG: response regulator [archaeon]|nr:response regulator [archaeon]
MPKIMVAAMDVLEKTQLEEQLTSLGYEVVGRAYSGESAVEKARPLRPDLILMDMDMPGKLDGIDAAKAIKAELDIPVIFLNASAEDKFVERAKNLESFGYITRPFHESKLKAAIEVALYRKDLERRLRGAEEALIKEKRFSENIIATISDSLLVLDKDLRIKRANRTFYETFQTEPERVIGSSITDMLGDKDGQLSTTLINRFGAEDMLENFVMHYQSEKQVERIFKVTARGIMVAEKRERERDGGGAGGHYRARAGKGASEGFTERERGASGGGSPSSQEQFAAHLRSA